MKIITLVPPRIISLNPAMGVIPGNIVSCSATGTSPIHTALVLTRDRTVLVNTTNTASIKLYEEGNYTCVAVSKHGTDVREFAVKGKRTSIV